MKSLRSTFGGSHGGTSDVAIKQDLNRPRTGKEVRKRESNGFGGISDLFKSTLSDKSGEDATEHAWRNVGYMIVYIIFNIFAIYAIYWLGRGPKSNRRKQG